MVPHSKGTNTDPLLMPKEESQTTNQEGDAAISRQLPTRGKLASPSLDSFILNDIQTTWSVEMQTKLKWMVHANPLVGSTVPTVPSTLSSKGISNGRALDDSQKGIKTNPKSYKLVADKSVVDPWFTRVDSFRMLADCLDVHMSKMTPPAEAATKNHQASHPSSCTNHPRAQVHGPVEIDVPTNDQAEIDSSKTEQILVKGDMCFQHTFMAPRAIYISHPDERTGRQRPKSNGTSMVTYK